MENSVELTAFAEVEYMQEDDDKPPDCRNTICLIPVKSVFLGGQSTRKQKEFFYQTIESCISRCIRSINLRNFRLSKVIQ
jgi:hypothetical protein